jgi:hypothetical protein
MADVSVNPVQVQKFLKGVDYPVGKQDILRVAQQNGADENVRKVLERLPDQTFNSPNDVSEAIGKLR